MTTATVPFTIVCPDWCEVPAEEHIRDLWDMEGNLIHHLPIVEVGDTVGFHASFEPPRYATPVDVNMTSQTTPEGGESSPPVVHMLGRELTVSQALALSEAIREVVYTYRVEGGVA